MLEIPKIKLNLKALEKPVGEEIQESTLSHTASTGELGEVSPSLSEISVVPPGTPIAKISLGGIKKSAQTAVGEVNLEIQKVPEEDISTLPERSITTGTVSQENIGTPDISVSYSETSPFLGNSETSVSPAAELQNSEPEEGKLQKQKQRDTEPVQFQNYESGFKKQSGNVLKKIQNFRYTPKTRKGLVIGLITLCVGTIGFLMIFFPEKHSLSLYRASILEIMKKESDREINSITQNERPTEQDTIDTSTPSQSETEDENIPSENTQDESAIRQEKKEKLRQHLIKKYSSS